MKYGIIGSSGRLGSEVKSLFNEKNHHLVFEYDLNGEQKNDTPQILIDCSLPEVFDISIGFAKDFNSPLIIATTGLSEEQIKKLKKFSELLPVVQSFNFSIGIQILLKLTQIANEHLPDWDIEINETHHRFKKDKPSGTAKMIENTLKERKFNTTSQRLGNVSGDHTVSFGGLGDVISISHRALSRRTFAEGILLSAEFALKEKKGFYSFTEVVFGK